MEPLTLALILAGSSAVKGIGQGISSYQKAGGMMSEEEKKMLQRLQREQEMGTLGFSDKEISDLTRTYRNPQQAMQKQQVDELKMAMGGMGGTPSDAFRLALAQQDQTAQMQAAVADKIAQQQVLQKQRDEQMLLQLSRQEAAQEAAKKAAIVEAITLGIGGAGETFAKGQLLGDETMPGVDASQEAMEMYNEYNKMKAVLEFMQGGGQ